MLNAVESLYQDQLKPYGRILRKRLAEKAAGMGFANLDVDIKRVLVDDNQVSPENELDFFFWVQGVHIYKLCYIIPFRGGIK